MRCHWIIVACLALALPSVSFASAEHASGTLYTRIVNGVVRAAVTIEIHPDRHLYHTEVGGDLDEFGDRYPAKPLRLIPVGTGITWSAPRVPEPERYVDPYLHNWAYVHSGTLTVYLLGRFEDGAEDGGVGVDVTDLRVELDGLTCSKIDGNCIRLRQVLETSGEGPEKIFAAFPEDWSESRGEMSPAELEQLRALGYVDSVEAVADAPEAGVVMLNRNRVAPGYRLYVEQRLCRATLMDIDGQRVREWSARDCEKWVQAELLPNGDLLVPGLDPPGTSDRDADDAIDQMARLYLMRLDWNGNVLWKARIPAHHDVEEMTDGRILAITRSDRRAPRFKKASGLNDNNLVILSAAGDELESLSLWDVLKKNDIGYKFLGVAPTPKTRRIDLMHANSVEFMRRRELVGRHPLYDLDNVLVSLRHQDSIVVINFPNRKLLWAWGQGELSSQHDAQMLDNGNILIFDNGLRRRSSRVVEMNPLSEEIVWEYGGSDGQAFYSEARGSNERLPNGNTLIAISNQGEAREVTPDGEVVWKFYSGEVGDTRDRQVIVRIHYYPPEMIRPLIARSDE